jgi:ferritin-like metal-binding protein YciE
MPVTLADGIIEEAEDVAGEVQNKSVRDAALIVPHRRSSITR